MSRHLHPTAFQDLLRWVSAGKRTMAVALSLASWRKPAMVVATCLLAALVVRIPDPSVQAPAAVLTGAREGEP
jgi:hypothetical protein